MSGRTDFILYLVTALSFVAAATDLTKGRIYNWLTLPALALGLGASGFLHGFPGLLDSFLGILAAFLIYGWMFWLGTMGGGDVKFLMALGAWGGMRYALEVGLFGVILGGLMAVVILLVKGRLPDFGRRLYHFLLTLFVKELQPERPKLDRTLTMPYGLPIAIAAVWIAWGHPLSPWGINP